MFFDRYPEFVEYDVRKDRDTMTVTSESLTKRCDVILPVEIIKDKNILDVGSALGAMGHYSLTKGANYYTGVEIQRRYRETSEELLAKYHDNFTLLSDIKDVTGEYDVVIACGVIHGFFNIFSILEKLCSLSSKYIIIETHNPKFGKSEPLIKFHDGKMVKTGDVFSNFTGTEPLPNKEAIDLIMAVYGFKEDRRLYPEPILNSHDGYRESVQIVGRQRFISRYIKGDPAPTLEKNINAH